MVQVKCNILQWYLSYRLPILAGMMDIWMFLTTAKVAALRFMHHMRYFDQYEEHVSHIGHFGKYERHRFSKIRSKIAWLNCAPSQTYLRTTSVVKSDKVKALNIRVLLDLFKKGKSLLDRN